MALDTLNLRSMTVVEDSNAKSNEIAASQISAAFLTVSIWLASLECGRRGTQRLLFGIKCSKLRTLLRAIFPEQMHRAQITQQIQPRHFG